MRSEIKGFIEDLNLEELKVLRSAIDKKLKTLNKGQPGEIHQLHQILAIRKDQYDKFEGGNRFYQFLHEHGAENPLNLMKRTKPDAPLTFRSLVPIWNALNLHQKDIEMLFSVKKLTSRHLTTCDFGAIGDYQKFSLQKKIFEHFSFGELGRICNNYQMKLVSKSYIIKIFHEEQLNGSVASLIHLYRALQSSEKVTEIYGRQIQAVDLVWLHR